ncbi:hypothetical protein HBH98_014200 [Parastagonospora nodorum]|nr:hypothetical protein HBH98_014200 [Parastagonospora nodorum]KAH4397249.1 hypothetical protein HBH97_000710 [Parastagonospora nodorum]KAH4429760.1 hypothetical protein HBH99_014260 [Parastagonospora nodorum]KAH4930717.1 hypothetical protein HBI79_114050 [Parastagonospora nodorum]KAH6140920.1 hypothetical protein HBI64_023640 [Parastagonospora nodorum]
MSITMSLPTSRRFITQLLDALPSSAGTHDAATNPLSSVPESAKKQLLSLQVLFPSEFLPALDLLDRRLVVRLKISDENGNPRNEDSAARNNSTTAPAHDYTPSSIYYVSSAQPRRHASSYDTSTSYQVRLRAWNCSCPAFAFAAFPAVHPEPTYQPSDATEDAWFGGVSLGEGIPPVCKHLLACVLVEKCAGLFGGFVVEREVGVEEAVGWAAGWGD